MNPENRHAVGVAALERLGGPDAATPILAAADVAPDLVRFAIDFAFGEVLSRPGLDLRTRELCTVAALSGLGHAEPQLKWHIEAALHVGATEGEVDQVKRIARGYVRPPSGGVDAQGPLDPVTRELATIALLTAIGTQPAALKNHLRAARNGRRHARADRPRPSSRWRSTPAFLRRSTAFPPPAMSSRNRLNPGSFGSLGSVGSSLVHLSRMEP